MRRIRICSSVVLIGSLLFFACGGPEGRKMQFYDKGKALYDQGDYVRSRLALKNAVQIDPGFAMAHYLLGMAELKQGNLNAAYAGFARAAELNPGDLEAQVQLGRLLLMRGAAEKAREKAALVLKSRPRHKEGLLLLGAVCLASGQPDQTVKSMTELIRLGATGEDVYLLLAMAQRLAGNDAGAGKTLLDGIGRNGVSLPLHRVLADLYAGQGKSEAAALQLRRMIALDPANYSYAITLAGLYWQSKDKARARSELSALLAAHSSDEKAVGDTAAFYLAHGEVYDAEQVLRLGVSVNKRSHQLRLALSDLYVSTGRPDKGIALLKECLALEKDPAKPVVIAAKNALAAVQLARGELAEAGRFADEVLKESADNRDANLTKGRLSLDLGDAPRAVSAFRAVVAGSPNDLEGHLLLSEAYMLNRDMDLALETLSQARKLEPNSRVVQLALVRYHMRMSDFPAAEGQLRKAFAQNPQDPQLLTGLGDLSLAAGKPKRAESYYRAATRTASGALAGQVKLSELFAAGGKPALAARELARAVATAPRSDELFSRLIQLYLGQGKVSDAAANCRARIAANSEDVTAHLLLGRVLAEQSAFEKAEASFKQAERIGGSSVQVALARAQLQVKAGDHQKARVLFEDILTRHPDSLAAANDFACLLVDSGTGAADLERGLKLAEQLYARRPEDPLLMDTLGWAHYRRGDYKKSAQLLQLAAAKLPWIPVVRYHAGMALYRSGDIVLARKHLQSAVKSPTAFAGRKEALEILRNL